MATGILRRLSVVASRPSGEVAPDALSLDRVYALHFKYVWRCLRGLGVDAGSVDDAAHDVFLVVSRRLPEFDGQRAQLTTWLYEIALRVARRYRTERAKEALRGQSGDGASESDAPKSDSAPAAGVNLDSEQSERLALARRALDTLDAEKREAFVLSRVEQLSAPEIAAVTGVPLNTVYSRIRAARLAFEAEIARLSASERRRQP